MSRTRYFALRAAQTVVMLWLVLTFLFVFFRLLPGSYTDLMVFQGASQEAVRAFEEAWALNEPLHAQYFRYMENLVHLDFGTSMQHQRPVWDYVRMRILNSFILIAPALTVAYILGSLIGAIMGSNRGSALEKYGTIPILVLGTTPIFFTGIFLIIVFAGVLDIFPTSGMLTPGNVFPDAAWWKPYTTTDFLMHYTLPFAAIVLRYLYLPVLIMRTSTVEVLGQGFFYYHRITGTPRNRRLRHLLKHASLPVITLYPISLAQGIGGLVVLEFVFNWPGIGFALVEAVLSRDLPVIQFVFFLVASFVIIGNFVVDIVYGLIDPRVSVES